MTVSTACKRLAVSGSGLTAITGSVTVSWTRRRSRGSGVRHTNLARISRSTIAEVAGNRATRSALPSCAGRRATSKQYPSRSEVPFTLLASAI